MLPGWQFIAVSYDPKSYTVCFFQGSVSEEVRLLGDPLKLGVAAPGNSSAELRIGGTAVVTGDRTPPAWIDEVRIYDEAMVDTSVLERVRLAGLGRSGQ